MTSRDPTSKFQLESFRKILKLEESKGYSDTAVVGGMDRLLRHQGL